MVDIKKSEDEQTKEEKIPSSFTDDLESTLLKDAHLSLPVELGRYGLTGTNFDDYKEQISLNFLQQVSKYSEDLSKHAQAREKYNEKKFRDFKQEIDKNTEAALVQIKEKIQGTVDDVKKELENKIESSKLTIIETLGIFVALFTFISIDFQVFRFYRDPRAISGLVLIFLGSIFLFIIFFDFFILRNQTHSKVGGVYNDKFDSIYKFGFGILSILLVVAGIYYFHKAPNENIQDESKQIKDEVYQVLKNDIIDQKKELVDANAQNKTNIDNLKGDLESIKKCVIDFGFTYKCFK